MYDMYDQHQKGFHAIHWRCLQFLFARWISKVCQDESKLSADFLTFDSCPALFAIFVPGKSWWRMVTPSWPRCTHPPAMHFPCLMTSWCCRQIFPDDLVEFDMISRNSFIPSFRLVIHIIYVHIARRLDSARARVRILGLFLKAVLKWEGMHTLYMCICAGRWCYGLCWSGVRCKAILCVLRLSFPRGAFSKITSKRFPALVICASCKPVLSPIRYARSKVILCQTGWWTPRVEQLDRWRMRQKWRMAQPLRLISQHTGPRAPEARTMSRMGEHGPVQVRLWVMRYHKKQLSKVVSISPLGYQELDEALVRLKTDPAPLKAGGQDLASLQPCSFSRLRHCQHLALDNWKPCGRCCPTAPAT